MKKQKVSEITDIKLDWAVGKCLGTVWADWRFKEDHEEGKLNYSSKWSQGGPIIEKHINLLEDDPEHGWYAESGGVVGRGESPLIASMRAYVASVMGDEIDVPEIF